MFQLRGKTITVAGKLSGRYAGKNQGHLRTRLRQLDAELLEGFDLKAADLIVLGAKSNGFLKRITRAGTPTITEAQLEAAVIEVVTTAPEPPPPPPTFSAYEDLFEPLRMLRARLEPGASLRARLVELLSDAAARGYDIGLEAPVDIARFGSEDPTASAVDLLVWFSTEGDACVLFRIDDPSAALRADLGRIDGKPLYTGDDCPLQVFGAGMRLAVAMGRSAEQVWSQLHGELENRNGWEAAGVSTVADLGTESPALTELKSPEALPSRVGRVFTVYDVTPL